MLALRTQTAQTTLQNIALAEGHPGDPKTALIFSAEDDAPSDPVRIPEETVTPPVVEDPVISPVIEDPKDPVIPQVDLFTSKATPVPKGAVTGDPLKVEDKSPLLMWGAGALLLLGVAGAGGILLNRRSRFRAEKGDDMEA